VKAVANGVKKFAKSTIGRVVIGVALGYFLGPAAASFLGVSSAAGVAAVSGFVGGFGSTMLAGKGIKEALKFGAIGGVTAGIGAGVMGGANAFTAGSYAGPTTVAGQWDNLVSGAKNLVGAGAPPSTAGYADLGSYGDMAPAAFPVADPVSTVMPPNTGAMGYQPQSYLSPPSDVPGFTQQPNVASTGYGLGASEQGALGGTGDLTPPPTTTMPTAAPDAVDLYGIRTTPTPKNAFSLSTASPTPPPGGTERGFFGQAKDFLMPSTPSNTELAEIGNKAFMAEKAATGSDYLANRAAKLAVEKATPSILRQYGPLAAAGLGVMSLAGGFKQPESEKPNITGGVTGQQLLDQDPARFGLPFGGATTTYTTPPAYYNPRNYQSQAGDPYAIQPVQPVRAFAEGGPSNVDGYPRKQGAINGPGTGTSDSIKALLSDGEFVFTAKAVRGAGQGSRRKGAKRMYQLMRSLEGKA
jgi:hypothetical protein